MPQPSSCRETLFLPASSVQCGKICWLPLCNGSLSWELTWYFVGDTGVLSRRVFWGVVSLGIADITWEGMCSFFVQGALSSEEGCSFLLPCQRRDIE